MTKQYYKSVQVFSTLILISLIVCVFGNPVIESVSKSNSSNYFLKHNGKHEHFKPAINLNYRLPRNVKPVSYDLTLQPDLDTGTYEGLVKITSKVYEATNIIYLHSSLLDILDTKVTRSGKALNIDDINFETVQEFLIIELVEELNINDEVLIEIEFEGNMMNKLVGLYTSKYLKANKSYKTIVTSKFEPTYARQAFPCFDEPDLKASFNITLIRPTDAGYHALSNMNQILEVNYGSITAVSFAYSVPMSTYLVCFLISDFAHYSADINTNGIGNNFQIRIFAVEDQLEKVNFALDVAKAVTEFYIQYFKVEYPLPKLDMAAIPDFASNAMEHWGLLTYRETALLYDPAISSTWNQERVAAVVAHELAHMWFGNLVTLSWWNDLWLNEGFARYMQYKSVNEVYPEWDLPNQFITITLQSVMKSDASTTSHPIVGVVETPNQITEVFDTINYDKGASIIRMLEDVVGAEKFADAVTSYLKKFQYANAVTDDFLTEVANQNLDFDVKLMMNTWTEQMGFPVVEVKRTSDTIFTLKQKRFFSNIEDYDEIYNDSEFNYTWTIPLTYYTNLEKTLTYQWFEHTDNEVQILVPAATKWIKLNSRQVGFYRVNYDESLWQALIAELIANPETFSIGDRAQILDDVFALADASQLSYGVALSTLEYLEKENDFVPWYVAANKLKSLGVALRYTDTYVDFLEFTRNLLTNIYNKVTWTVSSSQDHVQNQLRVAVLTAACSLGLPDCLTEAGNRFSAWLDDETKIPSPDLREVVYYYGMQKLGKESSWNKMWQRFVNEQDANEKLKLMYGLSAVRSPWLLNRFILLADNEEYVRRQDYFTCIQNIAENPSGESLVWDYGRDKLDYLLKRFGYNDRYLGRMWAAVTKNFNSNVKLEDLSKFVRLYPSDAAGEASRQQALSTIKYNIRWLKDNEKAISTWLQEQK